MAKIYQLMIGKKQIGEDVYDERDAIAHAEQVSIDSGKTVEIWMAEEHEVVPYDLLTWKLMTWASNGEILI